LKLMNLCARWLALAGGVLLCVLCVMVVISVSGRALGGIGLKPVPGDFELVEMGTAIAVFCPGATCATAMPWWTSCTSTCRAAFRG
jgi:hypothetical protein